MNDALLLTAPAFDLLRASGGSPVIPAQSASSLVSAEG